MTTKSNSSNTIDLTSEKLAQKGLSRLAKVLAPHPIAMDTVIKIIRTILTNPNNPKYRSMKWENKRFAETVKGAFDPKTHSICTVLHPKLLT